MEGRLLGVDFGLKRIGLAVCDDAHILATPLPVYHTKSMRNSIDRVAAVALESEARGIVVGLPLNLDGSESVQSGRARAFARNVQSDGLARRAVRRAFDDGRSGRAVAGSGRYESRGTRFTCGQYGGESHFAELY